MSRLLRGATMALVPALACVFLAGPALAADPAVRNPDCLACHTQPSPVPTAPDAAFTGTVAFSRCRTCHWIAKHPAHNVTDQCNLCHKAWPARQIFGRAFTSKYTTAYGYFYSSSSLSTDPDLIHELHVRGSWPNGYTHGTSSSRRWICGSCHAPAACGACHDSVPHATHPGAAYPGVTRTETTGTATGVKRIDTRKVVTEGCINTSCHDVAAFAPLSASTLFENDDASTVRTGTWARLYSGLASGSWYAYSRAPGSKITFNFSGTGTAELLVRMTSTSGYADIALDGVPQSRVDLYSTSNREQVPIFTTSELSAGPHTIEVTVVGTAREVSGDCEISIDAVRLTGEIPERKLFKPACEYGCHTDFHAGRAMARTFCYDCHVPALDSYPGQAVAEATKHMSVTSSTKALVTNPIDTEHGATSCANCHSSHTGTRAADSALCFQCHDGEGTTKPAGYSYRGSSAYSAAAHTTKLCGSCHAVHGASDGAGGTRLAALKDTEEKTCTGSGTGTCHSSPDNAVGGTNIYATVRAGAAADAHHDLTAEQQAASGARIKCSDCHNPHNDKPTAKYSNPDSIDQPVVRTFGDYVNDQGLAYVLVGAQHDGIPPVVSGVNVDVVTTGYLTPIIKWTTNEGATSYVDFGLTTAYELGTAGNSTLVTRHSVQMPALLPGTLYHYRIRTADALGNPATRTGTYTPVQPPAPPALVDEGDSAFADGLGVDVRLEWGTTTSPDGHPVEYECLLTAYYGGQTWTSGWTTNRYFDTHLWGDYYYFEVRARDAVHQTAVGAYSAADYFYVNDNTWYGSCPFLFVWDGEKFDFESDLNTGGKLGAASTSRPDPRDRYVLTADPALKDGKLEVRLVEERHETDYTDEFKLYTVDLPEGVDLYAEKAERPKSTPLPPAGLHTARDTRTPQVTRTDTGEDVTSKISEDDGEMVQLNDDRNVGFDYKTLELDLGDVSGADQVKIIMNAQALRPASAEGIARQRTFSYYTKLEVQDESGAWRSVPASEATLPNAMEFPRDFVFDIGKAMHDTTGKVRFTYLFKTCIDWIAVDTSDDLPVEIREVPLSSAVLGSHGFDAHSAPGELFEYVYGPPVGVTSYFPGFYTRFGDVKELLGATDDKFVIYGSGDELVLRFDPPDPPAEATRREYVAFIDGYYKSSKSLGPLTVEPLPFSAMSTYPYPETESYPDDAEHQAYRNEYNTRYRDESDFSLPGMDADSQSAAGLLGIDTPALQYEEETHYSANTDLLRVQAVLPSGAVNSSRPDAGWQSSSAGTSALPTIASPGTAVASSELDKLLATDSSYWITDLTSTNNEYNWQLARFDVSEADYANAHTLMIDWRGHGEPTTGYTNRIYVWNFRTGAWDSKYNQPTPADANYQLRIPAGNDNAACLACHDGAAPAGVTFPATGFFNVMSVWSANKHGTAAGTGFGNTGLVGAYVRGNNALPCQSCHDPHGNSNRWHVAKATNGKTNITISTGADYKNLCSACHAGGVMNWHSTCDGCHLEGWHEGGEAYFPYPTVTDSSDCSACHKHYQSWQHSQDDPSGWCDWPHCPPPAYGNAF